MIFALIFKRVRLRTNMFFTCPCFGVYRIGMMDSRYFAYYDDTDFLYLQT